MTLTAMFLRLWGVLRISTTDTSLLLATFRYFVSFPSLGQLQETFLR